jgi:glucose-6-phosphate 1-epimerase
VNGLDDKQMLQCDIDARSWRARYTFSEMSRVENIEALERHFGIQGHVTFAESALGGPVAHLSHRQGSAIVSLEGAQVLSWIPTGGSEVLWLSPMARLGAARAIRGGIPVCWPWFGARPIDASPESGPWPQHGLVRTRLWDVAASTAQEQATTITLTIGVDPDPDHPWPFHVSAQLTVSLGERLTVQLAMQNDDDARVAFTGALHTYVRVGDIGGCALEGLERVAFEDVVVRKDEPPPEGPTSSVVYQPGSVVVDREIDRIYRAHRGEVRVVDQSLGRIVHVSKSGSASTVVWNPWIEKSARLGDMPEGGYRQMVCIEAANTHRDVVRLSLGRSHRLSTTLLVRPI